VRRLVWLVLLAFALALPRASRADESSPRSPDVADARAAFERASTSSDADAAAAGLYFLGKMDDDAFDFAAAVARYQASLARQSSGPYSARATLRREQLESHREGDYAPLVRLEQLRRDPVLSNDAAAIHALVDAAATFPPGPVRVESRLLAAEAYRGRLHRPGAEVPLLWEVVRDPYADAFAVRVAASRLLDSALDGGDVVAAERAVRELGDALDPKVAANFAHLVRRHFAHRVALAEVGLFLALLTVALARHGVRGALVGTRRILPLAAGFCVFAAGGGGLLAASYEGGSAGPFLLLGPAMLAVIVLSRAWSAVGSRSVVARVTRSALSACCLVATSFLLLERVTPQVLDGFGL